MSKKHSMLTKIAMGTAAVALALSVAAPAAAQTKQVDDRVTVMTPGIFCLWFGWC